eukprot:7388633-Prymnesium_polylepis.1
MRTAHEPHTDTNHTNNHIRATNHTNNHIRATRRARAGAVVSEAVTWRARDARQARHAHLLPALLDDHTRGQPGSAA